MGLRRVLQKGSFIGGIKGDIGSLDNGSFLFAPYCFWGSCTKWHAAHNGREKELNVERCLQLHDGSPSATPMIWVSVKELKLSYYSKETLLFAMVT